MEKKRIQKIIADSGFCSRRRAEELILSKAVRVNGRTVSLGDKADSENDIITVNGEKLKSAVNLRYLKLYKPRGYVTTTADKHGRKIVTDLISGINERVYPIGRLDRNSEGIILLTNDGEFANGITHPSKLIQKKYRVTIPAIVSEDAISTLSAGVDIGEGERTQPCTVNVISSENGYKSGTIDSKPRTILEIIITEGKNRQIRRMCEAVRLPVSRLRRVSVGGVKLGMMKPGEYADLSKEELALLKQQIGNKSAVAPVKREPVFKKNQVTNSAGKDMRKSNDNYKKNTGKSNGTKRGI